MQSDLLMPREYYKPFEYPQAYEYWSQQMQSFWLHTEVSMDRDLDDWKFKLTEGERFIVGNILKSFVQSEILIGTYWRALCEVFPKPEIQMMCSAFAGFETIHTAAYAHLNDTLGLTDFEGFLADPIATERLDSISIPPTRDMSHKQMAVSLAVYSAFGEGVSLFSAFVILLSFAQRGLLKGLGEIVEMSIRDETLHAKAGCWLFNKFISEQPQLTGIKRPVYDAARYCVEIEHKFIDSVFSGVENSLPNCHPEDLKQFITQRANNQLEGIGLKANWTNISESAINNLKWFNLASGGEQHADFFASRVTQYARTSGWDDLWS